MDAHVRVFVAVHVAGAPGATAMHVTAMYATVGERN